MNLKLLFIAISFSVTALPGLALANSSMPDYRPAYVSDVAITSKVRNALYAEKNLRALDIRVTTMHGTVQLSGYVKSNEQIEQAVQVAQNVSGVVEVKNDLLLKGEISS
jgi:osmotically-inducible protein OsmY